MEWPAPRTPWTARDGLAPTTRLIRCEAFILLRSARRRTPRVLPAGAAVLSWASRPSRAFSPRPSEPLLTHRSLGPRHPAARLRARRARTQGPRDPCVGWARATDG